jgi:hypothetical protein
MMASLIMMAILGDLMLMMLMDYLMRVTGDLIMMVVLMGDSKGWEFLLVTVEVVLVFI